MTTTDVMDRLGQRWDRRQVTYRDGREPFTATSSVDIAAQPLAVWDFLDAHGVGVLLDHRHLKTFPFPGTPEIGVGHQYCSVSRTAGEAIAVIVCEIVEFESPHRLVQKVLNTASPKLEVATITADHGSQYTSSIGLRLCPGAPRRRGATSRSSWMRGRPR